MPRHPESVASLEQEPGRWLGLGGAEREKVRLHQEEKFLAPIDEYDEEQEDAYSSGPGTHLTLLTLLILMLMSVLIVLVGVEAIETEQRFFRRMTLSINQEIADLLSQQFAQSFSAATGLVEDLSRYPTVRRSLSPERPDNGADQLLNILINRNPVLRGLHIVDPEGQSLFRAVGVNALDVRPYPEARRAELLGGEVPSQLSEQYLGGGGELCIGFASAVLPYRTGDSTPLGTVEAEISLSFLQRIVDSVQVGQTGRVLVVDRDRNVIFSSAGFQPNEMEDFRTTFPADRAFPSEADGISYGPEEAPSRYLASFRTVKSVSRKGLHAELVLPRATLLPSFTSTVRPRELPDWMIVVQQDFQEGVALASRMKYNIVLLVSIGLVGLLVIARLWWDSARR